MRIFKSGKFFTYNTQYFDRSWDDDDIFIVTSIFAALKYKGCDDNTAYSLSSMYVYQSTMPELTYASRGNNIIPHSTKKNTVV